LEDIEGVDIILFYFGSVKFLLDAMGRGALIAHVIAMQSTMLNHSWLSTLVQRQRQFKAATIWSKHTGQSAMQLCEASAVQWNFDLR